MKRSLDVQSCGLESYRDFIVRLQIYCLTYITSDNEGVSRALKAETTQPVPRVRPEAAEIANQHKGFIKNLIVDVSNKPKNS